jgi:hypothetical protein
MGKFSKNEPETAPLCGLPANHAMQIKYILGEEPPLRLLAASGLH